MKTICAVFSVLCSGALFGQAPPPRVEFEVASIKPSEQSADNAVSIGVHIDGSQVHISSMSLNDYIRIAYRLKSYQVTGPAWLASERFEIDAKLPAGAPRDQVPEMLASLLADRFQLKAHRGSKEFPVYGLTVAAGGSRMKESPPDPEGDSAANGAVQVAASGSSQGVNLNFGHGSYFRFGDDKLEVARLTMTQFVDTLARFVDRPVVDMTGLTSRYDFTIDLTPEDYRAMLIRSAISAGVSLPPQAMRALEGASGGSLFAGLHALGLKLDPRKAPLEVLIVDQMRQTPTDN